MLFSAAVFASVYAGLVAAGQTFSVDVGAGELKFTPNNLTAEAGDMITFIFRAKNHTVTQSSFKDPCTPLEGGFDSGYVPTPLNATDNFTNYTIMVTDTKPKWVFCAQASPATGNHCHKGMVFSINPDNGNNTSADAYMKAAMALGANDPANVPAPAANATASAEGSSATEGSAPTSEGSDASTTDSAAGASATNGSAPASDGSAASATDGSSSSGSFLFPSGTDAGASSTDPVANAGATAAADETSSAASSGTSSATVPSKTSGAKSVARNSAAVLAAVGVVLGLVL